MKKLRVKFSQYRNNLWEPGEKLVKMSIGVFWIKPDIYDGTSQSAFTWSKLTIETLEQGMKYVQS